MDRLQAVLSPKLAGVAADKLWQFQLRKENKALLEQLLVGFGGIELATPLTLLKLLQQCFVLLS